MSSAGSYGAGGGGGGVGNVKFLTGNSGGPVAPDLVGNINVVGSGDITVVGNPGTNTLTIELSGAIANIYDADTGSATPALGVLHINGLGGIATSASGNTVDIGNDGSLATIYATDSGDAIPSAETLNIVGGTGIATSGSGNTVTIALGGGGIVESIVGDTGSPISGALTITGGTSGATFDTTGTTITESFNYLNIPQTNTPGTAGVIKMAGSNIIAFYGGAGNFNMSMGFAAGNAATTGSNNIGYGHASLNQVTSGFANVAFGPLTLEFLTTGNTNVAMGLDAMQNATTASGNLAIGNQPMQNLLTGSTNVAIGSGAGSSYVGAESNNILIQNVGVAAESNQIRIGTQGASTGQQNKCNIAGIYGSTVGGTNALVFIDNGGNLGTTGGTFSAVTSITGDVGGSVTGAVTLTGGSSGEVFTASGGNTLTASFTKLNMPFTNIAGTQGVIQFGGANVLGFYGGVGENNVLLGDGAGAAAMSGSKNTGVGSQALNGITRGADNTAMGYNALNALTTGGNNTALGEASLFNLVTGQNNIAIGNGSAATYTTSESSNIVIGSTGTIADANQIRIGSQGSGGGQQNKCNIAGIYGSTVGGTNAAVFIDNAGNLGTVGGSGGGGVSSITGDTGSALTGALSLTGGSSGAIFAGSGTTLTESFHFLAMSDTTSTTGYVQVGTQKVMAFWGGVANNNVFVGPGAGHTTVSGTDNDGFGALALAGVTTGNFNVGIGSSALQALTTSSENVAIGLNALSALTTGGGGNTVVGFAAGGGFNTGANNLILGSTAGGGYTGAESNNIVIGAQGVAAETHAIHIGDDTTYGAFTKCFIGGIAGVTVTSTAAVLVNTSTNQLGTVISSRRFKENIEDMGTASRDIYKLRPVKFNFKGDFNQSYGLIAEDVEEVMPYLVSYDKEGLPVTVKYHELPALLLNEIQRLKLKIDELEGKFNARLR